MFKVGSMLIRKEDVIKAVDSLSIFGKIELEPFKQDRSYRLKVKFKSGDMSKFLEAIMWLSSEGMDIRKPSIVTVIF